MKKKKKTITILNGPGAGPKNIVSFTSRADRKIPFEFVKYVIIEQKMVVSTQIKMVV